MLMRETCEELLADDEDRDELCFLVIVVILLMVVMVVMMVMRRGVANGNYDNDSFPDIDIDDAIDADADEVRLRGCGKW